MVEIPGGRRQNRPARLLRGVVQDAHVQTSAGIGVEQVAGIEGEAPAWLTKISPGWAMSASLVILTRTSRAPEPRRVSVDWVRMAV